MGRTKNAKDRPREDGTPSNRSHPKPWAGRHLKGENKKTFIQPFLPAKIIEIMGSIEAVKAFVQAALDKAVKAEKIELESLPTSAKGETVGVHVSLTKGELATKFEASKHLVRCWCINLVNDKIREYENGTN